MRGKKILCGIFAVVLGVAGLAACGGKRNSETDRIELWAGEQWVGNDYANLEKFIKQFNTTTDLGFKVELKPKDNLSIALQGAIQRGSAPDIITWGRFNTPTYVRRNYINSIQDLIDRDNIKTDELFYEEANKELIFEGKQYGLPLDIDVWGIYVNMDLLEGYNKTEAGKASPAVVPTNWTNLVDTAKKLRQFDSKGQMSITGYSTMDLPDFYFPYLTSTGADMIGADGYVDFNSAKSRETLKFLKKLRDENLCTPGRDTKSHFATGSLAMINQSVYYSSYLNKNYPKLNYQFIPLPAYEGEGGKNAGMLGGFSLAIPEQQDKFKSDAWWARRENSWKFMKWWLTNEENMIEWAEVSHTLPALKSVFDAPVITEDPVLSVVANVAPNYKMRPAVPGYYSIQVSVFNNEIPNYLNGTYTLDELISNMTTQANRYIDQYKPKA